MKKVLYFQKSSLLNNRIIRLTTVLAMHNCKLFIIIIYYYYYYYYYYYMFTFDINCLRLMIHGNIERCFDIVAGLDGALRVCMTTVAATTEL